MLRMQFSEVEAAMEEAEWCASTYRVPFALLDHENGFVVTLKSDVSPGDKVLETFSEVAPAVRCRNCGYVDERGADISIIQGPGGAPGFGEEARGDNL